MKTGKLAIKGTIQKSWQKIYETTLSSAATSVTISNLDGNTDIEYKLVMRVVHGTASIAKIKINNDSGTNYGHQYMAANNTTASAYRETSTYLEINRNGASGNKSFMEVDLYAKSGTVRTAISDGCDNVATTTVERLHVHTHSWNNTSDNITSLVIFSSDTDGLGIGTYIALYRRRV